MPIIRRMIDREGALVDLLVGVPAPRRRILVRHNMPVPNSIHVSAQIDTGATSTGIDEGVLRNLGLDGPVDEVDVFTSSTKEEPHKFPVYLAELTLLSAEGTLSFGTLRVLAHHFRPNEKIKALIGRDLLERCVLEYGGVNGRFTLGF